MHELTIDPKQHRRVADAAQVSLAEHLCDQAERAITEHSVAGGQYAELCGREIDLEADRAAMKLAAILRIMQTENELTHRPHSASSAESVVELDPEYLAHRRRQSRTVIEKTVALTAMHSARLTAELALARYKAESGLR